jgi:hypothetical protein
MDLSLNDNQKSGVFSPVTQQPIKTTPNGPSPTLSNMPSFVDESAKTVSSSSTCTSSSETQHEDSISSHSYWKTSTTFENM